MKFNAGFIAVLVVWSLAGCETVKRIQPMDAHQQCGQIGRGVNLGNALDAPAEGEWGVRLEEDYFRVIREAGFDSVRIPIRWSAHADANEPFTIDSNFFSRIDWAVSNAIANRLVAIVDIHHYEELCKNPESNKARFLALWAQIAEHYQAYPSPLIFEILNEPSEQLTPELWNQYLSEALSVIRRTNPDRLVIVGPGQWNNISKLDALVLPESDRNLVVTFHYYNPFEFTHQGASWIGGSQSWVGKTWEGNVAERKALDDEFDRAVAWAQAHDRPLFLGEFGAYSRAELSSRVAWTDYVARAAEKRGISWCYWDFCANFAVYDAGKQKWKTALLKALVPEE